MAKVKTKYKDYKVEDKNLERLEAMREDLEAQLKKYIDEEIKYHNAKLEASGALKVTMQLLKESKENSDDSK